jgi:lysophospholipase L1-like esterase
MGRLGSDRLDGIARATPRTYYLALGDSLSVGVQPIGSEARQFRTADGYPDQLAEMARQRMPGLRVAKLGYPGESTRTMLDGSLGGYIQGSQLLDAVAFLAEHAGSVAFVTIDIGFNDVPTRDLEGLAIGMGAVRENLPGILRELRRATGPSTPIIGMTIYDPLLAAWLQGREGQELARASVFDAVLPMNAHLVEIYRAVGIAVADVEGDFSTADFETQVRVEGIGTVPLNVARILSWTWAGAPPPLGPDVHANARGYRVIAESFRRVLFDRRVAAPLVGSRAAP